MIISLFERAASYISSPIAKSLKGEALLQTGLCPQYDAKIRLGIGTCEPKDKPIGITSNKHKVDHYRMKAFSRTVDTMKIYLKAEDSTKYQLGRNDFFDCPLQVEFLFNTDHKNVIKGAEN